MSEDYGKIEHDGPEAERRGRFDEASRSPKPPRLAGASLASKVSKVVDLSQRSRRAQPPLPSGSMQEQPNYRATQSGRPAWVREIPDEAGFRRRRKGDDRPSGGDTAAGEAVQHDDETGKTQMAVHSMKTVRVHEADDAFDHDADARRNRESDAHRSNESSRDMTGTAADDARYEVIREQDAQSANEDAADRAPAGPTFHDDNDRSAEGTHEGHPLGDFEDTGAGSDFDFQDDDDFVDEDLEDEAFNRGEESSEQSGEDDFDEEAYGTDAAAEADDAGEEAASTAAQDYEHAGDDERYLEARAADEPELSDDHDWAPAPVSRRSARSAHAPASERVHRLSSISMSDQRRDGEIDDATREAAGRGEWHGGAQLRRTARQQPVVVIDDDAEDFPVERRPRAERGRYRGRGERSGPRINGLADARDAAADPLRARWSDSARHHMSDMLASSPTPHAVATRQKVGARRRSSALILLGLPALLLSAFGGAYYYHSSQPVVGAYKAATATVGDAYRVMVQPKAAAPGKITDSIIQKQAAGSTGTAATAASDLPPPVAPDVVIPVSQTVTELTKAEPVVMPAGFGSGASDESATVAEIGTPAVAEAPPALTPAAAAGSGEVADRAPDEPRADSVEVGGGGSLTVARLTEPGAAAESATESSTATEQDGAALSPSAEPSPLVARGDSYLEIGDIASARLLYEQAVAEGDSAGAAAMGRSYDPVYFEKIGVHGVRPDAAKARDWYEKAVQSGYADARKDLDNLVAWLQAKAN